VLSADTAVPIEATVGVKDGLGVTTDATGTYTLTLALGTYDLVASAAAYLPATRRLTLADDQRALDLRLTPDQPRIAASTAARSASVSIDRSAKVTIPIANAGTQPLSYQARVLPDKFAIRSSDDADGPSYKWVDLPKTAVKLALADNSYKEDVPLHIAFPFYNYVMTDTVVTSNGTLAFSTPNPPYNGLWRRCFPDTNIFFYEIAPFRADLDPSRGGSVRYGTADGGRVFVLSYENVPLHTGPASQTFSFQVLLHPDGRIVFQYQKLAELPSLLAVGVQNSATDYQELGCGADIPLHDGLAIELRPQTSAGYWMELDRSGGTIAPAGKQVVTATLGWVRAGAEPLRGRIEITSNDAIRSRLIVPINATMQPAPGEVFLPQVHIPSIWQR
jgi:hypothetical protein